MTSEIALMNRHAIALAADSAVTVQYWRDGERKERYFKGANKIFNLSYHQPVALMINDTADLLGVPWEVLAKAYRSHLGTRSLPRLESYLADFLQFIEGNKDIYPDEYRRDRFLSDAITSASFLAYLCDMRDEISKEPDVAKRKAAMTSKWAGTKARVQRADFFGAIAQPYIDSLIKEFGSALRPRVERAEWATRFLDIVDFDELIATAITALHKRGMSVLSHSGIVIAGFGSKDFFPKLHIHRHLGMVLDRMFCEPESDGVKEISHSNVSGVVPLAQSDMVTTFINGASNSLLREMTAALKGGFEILEAELKGRGILVADAAMKEAVDAAEDRFGTLLTSKLSESHTEPMKRVVGMLPIDELAELAEILIRMESLKERVTRESEQVGGPIDVAVISKGDGFIWIKRKHYFDPELNPRYFARRAHDGKQEAPHTARKVRSRKKAASAS